jgi:hypothetical protein
MYKRIEEGSRMQMIKDTEHQTGSNSAISWTPNPWKASLGPAMLNQVPISVYLEKSSSHFSPLASFKVACINLKTEQVTTPLPTPQEHNLVWPLGRLKP